MGARGRTLRVSVSNAVCDPSRRVFPDVRAKDILLRGAVSDAGELLTSTLFTVWRVYTKFTYKPIILSGCPRWPRLRPPPLCPTYFCFTFSETNSSREFLSYHKNCINVRVGQHLTTFEERLCTSVEGVLLYKLVDRKAPSVPHSDCSRRFGELSYENFHTYSRHPANKPSRSAFLIFVVLHRIFGDRVISAEMWPS